MYRHVGFPENLRFVVYLGMMVIMAIVTRRLSYEKQLLVYLMAMVSFSSAMANQYLIIPIVALCELDMKWFRRAYFWVCGIFLVMHADGLGVLLRIQERFAGNIEHTFERFIAGGYMWATWILLFAIIYVLCCEKRRICK